MQQLLHPRNLQLSQYLYPKLLTFSSEFTYPNLQRHTIGKSNQVL